MSLSLTANVNFNGIALFFQICVFKLEFLFVAAGTVTVVVVSLSRCEKRVLGEGSERLSLF